MPLSVPRRGGARHGGSVIRASHLSSVRGAQGVSGTARPIRSRRVCLAIRGSRPGDPVARREGPTRARLPLISPGRIRSASGAAAAPTPRRRLTRIPSTGRSAAGPAWFLAAFTSRIFRRAPALHHERRSSSLDAATPAPHPRPCQRLRAKATSAERQPRREKLTTRTATAARPPRHPRTPSCGWRARLLRRRAWLPAPTSWPDWLVTHGVRRACPVVGSPWCEPARPRSAPARLACRLTGQGLAAAARPTRPRTGPGPGAAIGSCATRHAPGALVRLARREIGLKERVELCARCRIGKGVESALLCDLARCAHEACRGAAGRGAAHADAAHAHLGHIRQRERTGRADEQVHRLRCHGIDHGADVLACAQARGVQAIRARIGTGLEPGDDFLDVGATDQEALGPPDQHHVCAGAVDGAAGGSDSLDRSLQREQRARHVAGRVLDRQPRHASLDGEPHAVGLGMAKQPAACSCRKLRRLSATLGWAVVMTMALRWCERWSGRSDSRAGFGAQPTFGYGKRLAALQAWRRLAGRSLAVGAGSPARGVRGDRCRRQCLPPRSAPD